MITDDPIHPVFITGVIDGDGSFYISFLKTGKIKPGFHITSDNISIPLLEKIKYFFGNIGSILLKTPSTSRFIVESFDQLYSIVIPFMDSQILYTEKSIHYGIFKEVCEILKNRPNLSNEDKFKRINMAYNMNKQGKRRKYTKEEYINLFIK
jgi:hypothetical protein